MVIALAVLGLLAVLVWQTMEPGKFQIADLDTVRIFCLPRHTRTAAFAVGLKVKVLADLYLKVCRSWRSSVVEHSLGKGEVESSSLSVSSRFVFVSRAGVTQW